MKTRKNKFTAMLSAILFLTATAAFAQTTAFNFQGSLNDGGTPANGSYDLQFKLFDAIVGGNQVGTTLNRSNLQVINGVFSTTLDFGASSFTFTDRFLEISVRPAGSPNAFVVLGGRQQIMSVPFSINSLNSNTANAADVAVNAVNALNAQNALNATTAQNSGSLGGIAASEYVRRNVINDGDLKTSGKLEIGGNAVQPSTSLGMVKALIQVNASGTIARCYNGVTGSSTGSCDFHITQPLVGVYRINLGFPANQRFVSVIPKYDGPLGINFETTPTYRFLGDFLEIFLIRIDEPDDTYPQDFMLIVY